MCVRVHSYVYVRDGGCTLFNVFVMVVVAFQCYFISFLFC